MVDDEPEEAPSTVSSPLGSLPVEYSSVPPTGFRLWRVVGTHRLDLGEAIPCLASPYKESLWDGPAATAVCKASTARFHPIGEPVPALTCKCGLYATKQPSAIDIGGFVAEGEVELWGRVIEATLGYRATRMRIIGDLTLRLGCVGTDIRPGGAGVYPRSYCKEPVAGPVLTGRQYRPLCAKHSAGLLAADSDAQATSLRVLRGWLAARYQTDIHLKGQHQ